MTTLSRTDDNYHALVGRREPQYTVGDDYDEDTDATPGHPTQLEQLAALPPAGRAAPFATETRKFTVVEYGQVSGQVTLDGTGAGTIDFIATVPLNQYWLVDNIVGRGAAAGSMHLYERGNTSVALNDLDLVFAKALQAPGFSLSDFPNGLVLRPGAHPLGAFVGAGNAAIASMKVMYRVGVFTIGEQPNV